MPKQINTHLPGSALVRKFGLKGRYQPVLDEVIVPVTIVGQEETTQVRLCRFGAIGAASGVGNQRAFRMENPEGSGVLAVITAWNAVSGAPTTDYISILRVKGSTGASQAGEFRDLRVQGTPAVLFAVTASAAFVLAAPTFHLTDSSKVWRSQWILPPGWYVRWTQNAQNQTCDFWVEWTEQNLAQSTGG